MRCLRTLICLPPWSGRNHSFFLGSCDLYSYLRASGIETEIFDGDVALFASTRQHEDSYEKILQDALSAFSPSFAAVHVNTPNYPAALELIRQIKHFCPSCIIIAGGPHASVAWKSMLSSHKEIDFVSIGEGEKALVDLIKNFSKIHMKLPGGIAARINGTPVATAGTHIHSAEILPSCRMALLRPPFPALRRWAKQRYTDNFYNAIRSFDGRLATNAYAARGCLHDCPYCSPGAFWKSPTTQKPCVRIKSPNVIEQEFIYLRDNGYGAVYFDEMAFPFFHKRWLECFLQLTNKYDILWGGAAIFDHVKKLDLPRLHAAGLRYLYFGFETPQPQLQERINKLTNEKEVLTFIDKAFQAGVHCDLSIFFGINGESNATITSTVEWLNKNLLYGNAFFSIAAFWPGTSWSNACNLKPEYWEPNFDKDSIRASAAWYSHSLSSIGQFFSNSLGTYHPAFMTAEKALWIKDQIIKSGFRERFAKYARRVK